MSDTIAKLSEVKKELAVEHFSDYTAMMEKIFCCCSNINVGVDAAGKMPSKMSTGNDILEEIVRYLIFQCQQHNFRKRLVYY